jgi:hypothetical protein
VSIRIILVIIASIYGALNIIVGGVGVNKKEINTLSAIIMISGGVLTIVSILVNILPLLILSLLMIHLSAICNGYKMYGKINIQHHIVRAVFSILIILLFI